MKSSHVLTLTAAILSCAPVFSGTMGPIKPQKTWAWVATASAGPVWARGGENQTFYLDPDIENTYHANKSTNSLTVGELFLGIQRNLSAQWLGQIGLAAATTGSARLQGEVWVDADPDFYNYQYHYKIRHNRLALKGKLLFNRYSMLTPWVSGSAGVGFNRARHCNQTSLLFEAVPAPNFANHTKSAFSYTLGAGIQKAISTHWQAGVGYEFADWGKSELSRAPGQTMNTGLKMNHLYTNGVMFNLTFVA